MLRAHGGSSSGTLAPAILGRSCGGVAHTTTSAPLMEQAVEGGEKDCRNEAASGPCGRTEGLTDARHAQNGIAAVGRSHSSELLGPSSSISRLAGHGALSCDAVRHILRSS